MPKTPFDLTALRASLSELEAALASERRKRVRKRIVAISAILTGKSIKEAARAANTTERTVERCLKRCHQSGLASLLRDRRRRRPKWQMTVHDIDTTRREIASALAAPVKPDVRARLLAIDIVLSGRPIEEAAATAGVLPNAVNSWFRLVARDGFTPVLARWERKEQTRRPQIDTNPASLRELAANVRNPPRRKQILALALVAEGMSPHAAALAAGANYGAVLRRVRRFPKERMAALHDKRPWGRNLAPDQIQQLRAEISTHPDMNYRRLRERVAARFGVHYSLEGLRLLLRRDLGIVRKAGRFIEAAAPPPVEHPHAPSPRFTEAFP